VTWSVDVKGTGTLEGFSLPSRGELAGARVYDDSPVVRAAVVDGAYAAAGRFDRVIVPTEAGSLQVPAVELIVFSPTQGAYVTHRVVAPVIDVTPGGEGDVEVASFGTHEAVAAAPVDVMRPVVASGFTHRIPVDGALPWLLSAAAFPGAWALAGGLVVWWRARPRRVPHVASMSPTVRLARLPSDPRERLAGLEAAVREALARRARVDVVALVRDDAIASLPEELRELVAVVARELDRARFGDGGPTPDLERRVRDAVARLESP
jgi:hypothetical protein